MRRLPLLVVALSATTALAACGTAGADDGRPSVVASFYPLQYVAEQVGGDLVQVDGLTQPGGEAHDLELTPQQVGAVQDADVVVFQEDFQNAVDEAVEQADRDAASTVDAASLATALESAGDDGHDHGDEAHEDEGHADEEGHEDEGHADEEGHEEGHEDEGHADEEGHEDEGHADEEHADEEGHEHGDTDPHVWLDPTNMAKIATGVEEALSAADPDNADTYAANAERLRGELEQLDADFFAGLERCEIRDVVTSHAAFAYLAARYDLEQVPIAGIDPGNEPSGAQLAEISDLVQDEGITTVFTETLVSPAVAKTVAREAGVQTATLDPIEGLTDETSDEDYQSIMRQNLTALQKANSCS